MSQSSGHFDPNDVAREAAKEAGRFLLRELIRWLGGRIRARHIAGGIMVAGGEGLVALTGALLYVWNVYIVPPNLFSRATANTPLPGRLWIYTAMFEPSILFAVFAFVGLILIANGIVVVRSDSRLASAVRSIPLLKKFVWRRSKPKLRAEKSPQYIQAWRNPDQL